MPLADTAIAVTLRSTFTASLDLKSIVSQLNLSRGTSLDNGTGSNQADRIWDDTRTLAASATEDLDLAGSALLDPTGAAVVFARVKAICIAAATTNTNNVLVGGVANGWATMLSPAATGIITVRPGGGFVAWAPDATGYAVTGGTGDLLHIANSAGGTSVTYDVVIIGSSA